MFIYVIGWVC